MNSRRSLNSNDAILEMALRQKLDPAALTNTTRSRGLDSLLKTVAKEGCIKRDDFMVPSASGAGDSMCSLDFIPTLRNQLMHGNIHLPQGTLDVMRLCADIINRMFSIAANGP